MATAPTTQPSTASTDPPVEESPRVDTPSTGSSPPPLVVPTAARVSLLQIVLVVLGVIAFLYFARPVILPVFLASVAAMTLKPLIRWLSYCRIPPALSAAIVLCLVVLAIGIGFFQLGRPAVTWINEAPQHMTELRRATQRALTRCVAGLFVISTVVSLLTYL